MKGDKKKEIIECIHTNTLFQETTKMKERSYSRVRTSSAGGAGSGSAAV